MWTDTGSPTQSCKRRNITDEALQGMDKKLELKDDQTWYYMNQIWTPKLSELRSLVMDEAHKSRYFIHPGSENKYQDLNRLYW